MSDTRDETCRTALWHSLNYLRHEADRAGLGREAGLIRDAQDAIARLGIKVPASAPAWLQ
jgi:hypothetical protein